jgi:hypothetical protein
MPIDQHARPRRQAQAGDDGLGQVHRLVGDDAPGHAGPVEFVEHRDHVVEHPGGFEHALGITLQECGAQAVVGIISGLGAEGQADHAASAGPDHRTQGLYRQRRQTMCGAEVVRRAGQVGCAVNQRAVQVEQHRIGPDPPHAGRRQAIR